MKNDKDVYKFEMGTDTGDNVCVFETKDNFSRLLDLDLIGGAVVLEMEGELYGPGCIARVVDLQVTEVIFGPGGPTISL